MSEATSTIHPTPIDNLKPVKIRGRDDSPGRPLIYKTTDTFLKSFGLNRLSDLPKLKEISEINENEPELIEQIDAYK